MYLITQCTPPPPPPPPPTLDGLPLIISRRTHKLFGKETDVGLVSFHFFVSLSISPLIIFSRIPKLFWQRDQRVSRSLCFLDRDSEHGLLLYVSTYILSWTTIFSEVALHVSTFFLSWTTTSCECSFLVMDYNMYKCLVSFEVFLSLGYRIQSSTSRTRLEFHFS